MGLRGFDMDDGGDDGDDDADAGCPLPPRTFYL